MKQRKNKKDFNKDFLLERIKEYGEYRNLGYSLEDIEYVFFKEYGLQDISSIRKGYDLLQNTGKVEINIDSKLGLKKLAIARNRILIDRKINVKQKSLLNNEQNVEAFRRMITDTLSSFKWQSYPSCKEMPKKCLKNANKAVYIISDEHFKGNCDIEHLNIMYDNIEKDIKREEYASVELWYLGDGVDGLIHAGSLSSNEGAIIPSIQYVNIMIERINKIPQVKSVKFVCKSNHTQTRPLGTSRNELAKEDLGFTIANTLSWGLRKDIQLVVNDIIIFKYNKLNIALLHGHQPYARSKAKMVEFW